jgi:GrpB-like predicted nucleotidyltransferase (UPF0157 family)
MTDHTIKLVDFNQTWAEQFNTEKLKLHDALSAFSHEIEHIGSTAVPNTPAKPIIDIAIRLESLKLVPRLIPPLSKLSYAYRGEYGLPGRHFFVKGDPKEFHLHIVDQTTEHWQKWIKFCDILQSNETLKQQYIELKQNLAEKYALQREKYTESKSEFINSIIDSL